AGGWPGLMRSVGGKSSGALPGRRPSLWLSAVSLTARSASVPGSAEHVANVRSTDSASLRLLLVLAGQHLANQSEGQQLNSDDHQQHTEQQKRPLADPGAADLVDGEVDENHTAGERRDQAHSSEQVERAVAVPAHEDDRKEVERGAQVALDSEPRASVHPGAMIDGQLSNAEALVMSEHRDEAVALAVQAHVLEDLGPIRLQTAVH